VQMWLAPAEFGGEAEYEVVRGIADGTPYAVPRAGAMLHLRRLADGERTAVPDAVRAYVHVVRGAVRVGEERLEAGDAARITDAEGLELRGLAQAECLVWEMGPEPTYM
jgi:redox-sensitive bicupin YhaK (pirin superfamily)